MREMRRKDRKLEIEDIHYVLNTGEYGVLSTVTPDGTPYSIPISYAYDEDNNVIYMHCTADGGQNIENITFQPVVCYTIVTGTEVLPENFSTRYWSVNVFGKIDIITNTEQKKEGLRKLLFKYSADFKEKGLNYIDSAVDRVFVLKLSISEVTGKARKQ